MKILAIEKEMPGLTNIDFKPHLEAEAQWVWELQQSGIIREIYFRQDRGSAVLVLECKNASEAEAILSTLPLAQKGTGHFRYYSVKSLFGVFPFIQIQKNQINSLRPPNPDGVTNFNLLISGVDVLDRLV